VSPRKLLSCHAHAVRSQTLGHSLLPQLGRPLVALGYALAIAVQGAQVELRISMALGHSLLPQLGRPLVALGHALARVIAAAQITQRLRLAPGSNSHELRGGRADALGSGGGGRATPAFADPDNLARLPLRRRHPARRLVALPVRALALGRAVEHGAAAGAQAIRVVLLGSRTTNARADVAYAVHGGGRGRALECTVQRNVKSIYLCALFSELCPTHTMASSRAFPIFVVDAFASAVFKGNPAAVVFFGDDAFPDAALLQSVASENNLAETAFVRRAGAGAFALRFFTPEQEIDLCGHATLASAHVLFNILTGEVTGDALTFTTLSAGCLTLARRGVLLELDFPSRPAVERAEWPGGLLPGIGLGKASVPLFVGRSPRDYLVILSTPEDVLALRPDFRVLDTVKDAVVCIAAAPGTGVPGSPDFVCRAFCPNASVPEDPVCGSAHCTLIPYFASTLGRSTLLSHQVSRRGGALQCVLQEGGARVRIAGTSVLYLRGEVFLPWA